MDPRRHAARTRLACTVCRGSLESVGAGELQYADDPDLACIRCSARYAWSRGVLDLMPGVTVPPRRYGADADFSAFLDASLQTRAYRSTDLDDGRYRLLSWADPTPGEPLALLGGGAAGIAVFVAEAVPDVPLLVLDDDLAALKVARRQLVQAGRDDVLVVRGSIRAPSLQRASLRSMLHYGVLHAQEDAGQHLLGLADVLVDGGRAAGITLARSTLPQIAAQQEAMESRTRMRFVALEPLAKALMTKGYRSFRHEQTSNWLASFVAQRA